MSLSLDKDTATDTAADAVAGADENTAADTSTEAGASTEAGETAAEVAGPAAKEKPVRLWRRRSWRRVALAFALLAFIALASVTVWAWTGYRADQRTSQAWETAAPAASKIVVSMFDYDGENADRTLHAALSSLSGPFADEYRDTIENTILPNVKGKTIKVIATVQAKGVVSANGSDAKVLIYLNQATVSGQPQDPITASRLLVTLHRDNDWFSYGPWKMTDLRRV